MLLYNQVGVLIITWFIFKRSVQPWKFNYLRWALKSLSICPEIFLRLQTAIIGLNHVEQNSMWKPYALSKIVCSILKLSIFLSISHLLSVLWLDHTSAILLNFLNKRNKRQYLDSLCRISAESGFHRLFPGAMLWMPLRPF